MIPKLNYLQRTAVVSPEFGNSQGGENLKTVHGGARHIHFYNKVGNGVDAQVKLTLVPDSQSTIV